MTSLRRRLGVIGSMAFGVAAMLGAGVFYVWTPAWELAGEWFIVSLALAALVASLNGLVTMQLAVNLPVSGGIYSYAGHYRHRALGFLAGWFFLTGKTASAGAIALIAARYLLPEYDALVATVIIVVFTAVIVSGIRTAASVSILTSLVVIAGLLWLATPALVSEPPDVDLSAEPGWGVLTAAGLIFFAFAGYARMATLGEEVLSPRRTLPRAIVGALVIVLAVYALVALALLPRFQAVVTPPDTPLLLIAQGTSASVLTVVAVVSALGSLLAVLAGLSRTSLQMARNRDIPNALAHVSTTTQGPIASEIAVGFAAIALVWLADPLWLVGLSGAGVLSYYAIGHVSALAQPRSERLFHPVVPVVGMVLCGALIISLPLDSLLAWMMWSGVGVVWYAVASRRRSGHSG